MEINFSARLCLLTFATYILLSAPKIIENNKNLLLPVYTINNLVAIRKRIIFVNVKEQLLFYVTYFVPTETCIMAYSFSIEF